MSLQEWFTKFDSRGSNISILWKLVKNKNFRTYLRKFREGGLEIDLLIRPQGDSDTS